MKSIRMLTLLVAMGSLMLAACERQQRATDVDVRADEPAVYAPLTAGDLIGKDVENRQGETLGTIDDLAIDLETGNLTYALVSSGGVLGVGATHRVIPAAALELKRRDKEKDTRYGDTPADDETMRMPATGDAGQTMTPQDRTAETEPGMRDDVRADRTKDHHRDWAAKTVIVDMTQEQWEQQEEITRDDFFLRDAAEHREFYTAYGQQWRADVDAGRLVWATDLRGSEVVLQADERAGTVDEIVVNMEDTRVPFVVVSTARVLETEDDRYMVPTNMLSYDHEQNRVTLAGDANLFRDARDMRYEDWEAARRAEQRNIYVFHDFDQRGERWGDQRDMQRDRESPYN